MKLFYLVISVIYAILAVSTIPYLTYLRCKRLYSEFIFEQIQVYTTNTIMEFGTTQSFVKSIEGVYETKIPLTFEIIKNLVNPEWLKYKEGKEGPVLKIFKKEKNSKKFFIFLIS